MSTEETQKDTVTAKGADTPVTSQRAPEGADTKKPAREFKKNRRPSTRRRERPKSEFDQKILDIRRVTRVSSGGRRFSFAVAIAIGDRKGRVGIGTGKAGDTSLAIDKAVKNAKKNLVTIKTTASNSIPHNITHKYSSARIMLMPAPGRGIIAGSAVRDCLELAGLSNINGKIISGSKNKLNIARATVQALDALKRPVGKDAKAAKPKEVKKVVKK